MKYNLANVKEATAAIEYLVALTGQGKMAEVKKISPKRSINQNSYLHLLLGAFGQHFGYTLEEAKMIYKTLPGNLELYGYTKEVRGKKWEFLRSSADLTKEEMAKTIDKLHEWSKKGGYPLPPATDQEWLRQVENDIERNGYYL